ncbi:AMP-binding protein [Haliangium sp.]|uniref:AMP-binding protein n=1 Tax=Haliangium sp. TaxID=2663208 RepID=UPI003D1448B1
MSGAAGPGGDPGARERARQAVWAHARGSLDGLPEGGLNLAHEAVFRHAVGPRAEHPALRFARADGEIEAMSYARLAEDVAGFAADLAERGVAPGEAVFTLLGRAPAWYHAGLGALAHGAVFCPLFASLGPEPVAVRLARGDARVLVTTPALYAAKVAPIRDRVPGLRHVILVEAEAGSAPTVPAARTVAPSSAAAPTRPDDPALLHFTSGTTGMPKGAVQVHEAAVAHAHSAREVFELGPDDVFWCTADAGWVTGTVYGMLMPLIAGVTSLVDEGGFEAGRWCRLLADQGVTVWYTSPTALRMLMKVGAEAARARTYPRLRLLASVGEPLDAGAVAWGQAHFGQPVHDTWWQTETGAIMIANPAGAAPVPGAMGVPVPGVEAAIARVSERGPERAAPELVVIDEPGQEGMLVLRTGWPSMFRTYLHEPDRYRACFAGGWYLTGDLARRDSEGRFWFVGRADDAIESAGHLIGPFEVESGLRLHPAVADAAAVGVPDPITGERVVAFVELAPGATADEGLRRELLGFARKQLGPAVAPKQIVFHPDLPRTQSGKVLRRLLRERALGPSSGGDLGNGPTAADGDGGR